MINQILAAALVTATELMNAAAETIEDLREDLCLEECQRRHMAVLLEDEMRVNEILYTFVEAFINDGDTADMRDQAVQLMRMGNENN